MTNQQRMICRAAERLPYRLGASARFDDLAIRRKSWGYWFVERVAMRGRPDIRS